MLIVVARYRAKAGKADTVAEILRKHVEATRAEPGCLQFDACRSLDDPAEFVLYEKYVDEQAFETHRTSAHFTNYILGQVVPMLEDRQFHRCEELPTADA